jgi:23S rRNA pseudouridine2457 synthase
LAQLILLNKPFNVLSQFKDNDGRTTLASYIDIPEVYPAGRLDFDSEGLMLLTDSGPLQHSISHPDKKMEKTYWAQVDRCPTDKELDPLRQGIKLKDGMTKPAQVTLIQEPMHLWERTPPIRVRKDIPTQWLEITISEGRNRQVRRMTAAIGYPTLRLIRCKIGVWSLGKLQPGEFFSQQIEPPRMKKPNRPFKQRKTNRQRK